MKRSAVLGMGFILVLLATAHAEWMWTPESGKWISEKNIEKKSAMLLFEQAQSYEQAGDLGKAIGIYRKLIKQYPASSVAPDAQYWIGHLLEEKGEYFKAYKEYQKVIENYPSYKKFNEILEREYQIGNLFLSGEKTKLLGMAILPAVDKAIEIFESIVRTAPYSSIAPRAQFNIGEAYRLIHRYAEAIPAYQRLIDNYPESDLAMEARYQIGQCGYQKTLNASYDQTNTDVALDSMKTFMKKHQDSKKSVEIQQKMDDLIRRKAKKSFDVAEFYNRSGAEEAAIIYYQDVIDNFPETDLAKQASKKIDALIARPTKKKYTDKFKETTAAKKEPGEKGNLLGGLWPFGKKEQVAAGAAVATAAAVKEKPKVVKPAKKPFWAFWVKEEKPVSLAKLDNEETTLASAASQMRLPDRSGQPRAPVEPTAPSAPTAIAPAQSVVTESVPAAAEGVAPIPSEPVSEVSLATPASQELPATPEEAVAPASPAIPAVPPAPAVPSVLQVKAFQVEEDGSALRLLFETNGDLEFKTFYLKDPSRILVSFPKGVYSKVAENIDVHKLGVASVRQHFRSREGSQADGRPLNAIVVDLEKTKEAKVYNDVDTFVIEVQKG